jgi:hypothetical protein
LEDLIQILCFVPVLNHPTHWTVRTSDSGFLLCYIFTYGIATVCTRITCWLPLTSERTNSLPVFC